MIFKDYIFDNFDETEILRDKMNGFDDPELINFDLIALYPSIKKDYKEDYGEIEYIKSYLQGAKLLCNSINRDKGIKIFNDYSLTLPILYLCRQCIELTIKFYFKKCHNKAPVKNHNLMELWEELKKATLINQTEEDMRVIDNMGGFIETIILIDDNGTRLRYSKQIKDSYSQENIRFVNVNRIIELTEKFIEQLKTMEKK